MTQHKPEFWEWIWLAYARACPEVQSKVADVLGLSSSVICRKYVGTCLVPEGIVQGFISSQQVVEARVLLGLENVQQEQPSMFRVDMRDQVLQLMDLGSNKLKVTDMANMAGTYIPPQRG